MYNTENPMNRDDFIHYLKNRVSEMQDAINLSRANGDDTAFQRGELYATVHMLSVITGEYPTAEPLVIDGGEHF